jgi:hypothetical protein
MTLRVDDHLLLLSFGHHRPAHPSDTLVYHLRQSRHDSLGLLSVQSLQSQLLYKGMGVEMIITRRGRRVK